MTMRIEAGRFKGRRLPAATAARPVPARLKRSLFMVLAPRLGGARVLDLFAGVGGLGLEALSRGAAHVTLLDRDPSATRALARWLEAVGAGSDEARVLQGDAVRGRLPDGPFDLVFLDPPFSFWDVDRGGGEGEIREVLARAVARLHPGGRLVLKVPAGAPLPADARWREARRRTFGRLAWVLAAPGGAAASPRPQAPSSPGGGRPMEG